jgi:hypothetical protein
VDGAAYEATVTGEEDATGSIRKHFI